jgi:predicted nucleic acid-binding protein
MTYGEIMGRGAQAGRPMAIPDGMIAATTLAHGGSLATRNVDDFRDSGIDLVNPWQTTAVQER